MDIFLLEQIGIYSNYVYFHPQCSLQKENVISAAQMRVSMKKGGSFTDIQVMPTYVELHLFGQTFSVRETYISSTLLVLLLIAIAVVIRVFFISRFTLDKPKPFQVVVEYVMETLDKFTAGAAGHLGTKLSPYILALGVYIITNGWVELFGVRTPLSDLSVTATLALITFILINYYGFRAKGIGGRFASYLKPNPVMAPFKLISDMVLPISLASRMFGNLLGGFIVMELLYEVFLGMIKKWAFTVVVPVVASAIPGILAMYFTIFHAAIQFYIFSMLSLTFISEATE